MLASLSRQGRFVFRRSFVSAHILFKESGDDPLKLLDVLKLGIQIVEFLGMSAQRLSALEIKFSPGSLNIRFRYLLQHSTDPIRGEAARLARIPIVGKMVLLVRQHSCEFCRDARAIRSLSLRIDSQVAVPGPPLRCAGCRFPRLASGSKAEACASLARVA